MRQLALIVHISLDGFVAGLEGELDNFPAGEENLAFVNTLTAGVDTVLFGRRTYELLNKYWPTAKDGSAATKGEIDYSNWYNSVTKLVVSTTMAKGSIDNTTIISSDVCREVARIKEQKGGNILIFGSPSVARLLMQQNLIDSYRIFINPVIFGNGILLFAGELQLTKLKLVMTKPFLNGEIALNYELDRQ